MQFTVRSRSAAGPPTGTACRSCRSASTSSRTGRCSISATAGGVHRQRGASRSPASSRIRSRSTGTQFMALPQADDVSDFHCVTTWSRSTTTGAACASRPSPSWPCRRPRRALRSVHRLRLHAGQLHSLHRQPPAGARGRGRRAAGAHLGRPAAAARARRPGADDHAQAVRVEGRRSGSARSSSSPRIAKASGKCAATRTPRSRGSTIATLRSLPYGFGSKRYTR